MGWQDVGVLLAVLGASAYLARLAWSRLASRSTAGCASGGCGGCPLKAGGAGASPGLVQIGRSGLNHR